MTAGKLEAQLIMAEVLTLFREDFDQKCPKAFKELWLDTDFSDVTLASEDGCQLTAHKVILAACSPLFKRLLQKNPNSHPLLYLMGVQSSQLQQILSYIYLGQCDLTQEQLPAFMATCKQLEIEGLTGVLTGQGTGVLRGQGKEVLTGQGTGVLTGQGTGVLRGVLKERSEGELSGEKSQRQEKLPLAIEQCGVPLKAEELRGALESVRMDQDEDEDMLETSLDEIFQDKVPGVNNTRSIIANQPNLLQCQFCEYRAAKNSFIKYHLENVHKGVKYDCTNCDYKSGDKGNLKKHMESIHLGITYTCEICKFVANSKSLLKRHVDIKHNGLLFNCEKCQYQTTRKNTFDNHILVTHNGVTFDCNVCQYKGNSKRNLSRHMKITHEELRYKCQECDGLFKNKASVKKHVNSVHKGFRYQCDLCEKQFRFADSISTHKERAHFKAIVYGVKTLSETAYSMMTELNSGWRCKQCGKESINKFLLRMHIESEHMGISHTCELCGHTYKNKSTFRGHVQDGACDANIMNIRQSDSRRS